MFIDVFTSIPFDQFITSNKISLLRMFKFAKILKSIRLFKYTKILSQVAHQVNISDLTLRLGAQAVVLMFLIHFVACIFYFTSLTEGTHSDTWVVQLSVQDSSIQVKYLYSLYWALQTLTTVGYGDIPTNTQS